MKKKTWLILASIIIILVIIVTIIFSKTDYKLFKMGNTISNKTVEQTVNYILNMNSYAAQLSLEVTSNKNTNKYLIKQQYTNPNICKQEVMEPTNIARTYYHL